MVEDWPETTKKIAYLLATKFISRRDPAAQQTLDGGYRPLRTKNPATKEVTASTPFTMDMILDHLDPAKPQTTYGYYLLDDQDKTKMFIIDVDLQKEGYVPSVELPAGATEEQYLYWRSSFYYVPDLRGVWHDRSHLAARQYLKKQMRILAGIFAGHIHHYIEVPSAAAYSGNKGVHVYGFTGSIPAAEALELGKIILHAPGYWVPSRGDNFYVDSRTPFDWSPNVDRVMRPYDVFSDFDPGTFFNFCIEVYPKQETLAGKDLGNLIRLPLGTNQHHPSDPTFFIDLTSAFDEFRPIAPLQALTALDPYSVGIAEERRVS